ncbi:MAG: hypothetical protein ACE5ID_03600, partial [Acidobacteriota bacterium]
EQVLVFLKPAADGALETAGLFFGKFTIEFPRRRVQFAVRDLSGAGIIGGFHADGPRESLRASVLTQAAAAIPLDSGIPEAFRPHPVGMDQLLWDDLRELTPASPGSSSTPAPPASTGRRPLSSFVALSTVNPTRWHQSDSSLPVLVDIERAGNPLGDGLAAVAELERAMAAWTNVPEARLELRSGNTDVQYVAAHPSSPTSAFPPSNIILFNDPYGDINPVGCAGVSPWAGTGAVPHPRS